MVPSSKDLGSQTVYSLLRAQSQAAAELLMRETAAVTSQGAVSHALDVDGRPILLVPIAPDDVVLDRASSRGLSVRRRELLQGGSARTFMAIRCEEDALARQFAVFADDVIAAVADAPSDSQRTALDVLGKWRELFAAAKGASMGPNALAGLLAELHLLEQVAHASPGGALELWRGWDAARQDFQSAQAAVEVKATTSRSRFVVEIHGLWQLEEPEVGPLLLFAEQMDLVTQGGDSVPDAVDRLIGLGIPACDLYQRLGELGYHGGDSQRYRMIRFQTLQSRACLVDDAFPKLVRGSLRDDSLANRLMDVNYSVDVGVQPAIPGDACEVAASALLHGVSEATLR